MLIYISGFGWSLECTLQSTAKIFRKEHRGVVSLCETEPRICHKLHKGIWHCQSCLAYTEICPLLSLWPGLVCFSSMNKGKRNFLQPYLFSQNKPFPGQLLLHSGSICKSVILIGNPKFYQSLFFFLTKHEINLYLRGLVVEQRWGVFVLRE